MRVPKVIIGLDGMIDCTKILVINYTFNTTKRLNSKYQLL